MREEQYPISPFHQTLHEFQAANPNIPLFHIDLHGKDNRPTNCELDIGIVSMEVLWEKDDLSKYIK